MNNEKHSKREAHKIFEQWLADNLAEKIPARRIVARTIVADVMLRAYLYDLADTLWQASRASKPEGVDAEELCREQQVRGCVHCPEFEVCGGQSDGVDVVIREYLQWELQYYEGGDDELFSQRDHERIERATLAIASLAHPAPQNEAALSQPSVVELSAFINQVDAQTIHGASEDDYAQAILARYNVTERQQATGGGDE